MNSKKNILGALLLFAGLPLFCARITIYNETSYHLKVDIFKNEFERITICDLYTGQSETIDTGFENIRHFTWQEQKDMSTKTLRYRLEISIPWYMLVAGNFNVYEDGRYSTTFFGKGKIEGIPHYFWKKITS